MSTSLFTVIPSIIKLPSSQSTDTSWKVTNHEKSYYGSEVSPRFVGDWQKLVEIIIRIAMNKLIFFQRNFYHCNQLKIPQISTNTPTDQTKPTNRNHSTVVFFLFNGSVPFSKGIASFASSAVAKTTAAVPFPWGQKRRGRNRRIKLSQQKSLLNSLFMDVYDDFSQVYVYI